MQNVSHPPECRREGSVMEPSVESVLRACFTCAGVTQSPTASALLPTQKSGYILDAEAFLAAGYAAQEKARFQFNGSGTLTESENLINICGLCFSA